MYLRIALICNVINSGQFLHSPERAQETSIHPIYKIYLRYKQNQILFSKPSIKKFKTYYSGKRQKIESDNYTHKCKFLRLSST
tara:strand:+ start:112606 stop:112854 length:249 start_codon:yes stop_codon:yes gene_type:complete